MARLRNNPCKGCEKRTLGCHSECEEYIQAKQKHSEAMTRERLKNEIKDYDITRKRRRR